MDQQSTQIENPNMKVRVIKISSGAGRPTFNFDEADCSEADLFSVLHRISDGRRLMVIFEEMTLAEYRALPAVFEANVMLHPGQGDAPV